MTCQFAGVTLLFYFVLILSTNLFVLSSPCFITNCPPGGKRSGNTLNELKQVSLLKTIKSHYDFLVLPDKGI